MELLAPAGTLEVFEVAVGAGADAVYIGAPFFNAREPARHFSMAELAAMIDHAHRNGVKLYMAMNSLVKEDEIARLIETLAMLEELGPDALIIQDPGIYYLVRNFFPGLRIHASTLMAAHNSMAVQTLTNMGFSRVVLPRELTMEEIAKISAVTDVELEVFIHGAMCFSYSGLCLFSSFQGGRSGLRGRCVQPCRRRYSWQGRGRGQGSGYLFSMNDLQGIGLLGELRKAGVSSLKIEGRLRSANYVGNVVKAYRLALDSGPADRGALREAEELLERAMGRKATRGYFSGVRPSDLIAPQHSGNIGIFLGKLKPGRGQSASLVLNGSVNKGDRLRLHQEKTGERLSFSLKNIRVAGKTVEKAGKGTKVAIELPALPVAGDTVYKVDLASDRGSTKKRTIRPDRFAAKVRKLGTDKRIRQIVASVTGGQCLDRPAPWKSQSRKGKTKRSGSGSQLLPIWARSDDPFILRQKFPLLPERVVINLSGESFNRFLRMKRSGPLFRRIVWALPPIIDEERLAFFQERISKLIEMGFMEWQVAHYSQISLFEGTECRLYGDHTLNILNGLALRVAGERGLQGSLISIETDRQNLAAICRQAGEVAKGMVVYSFPALFTSRYTGSPMQYGRTFASPRGERFSLRQAWGYTMAVPETPFSLLPDLVDLARLGVEYAVVDLSGRSLDRRSFDDVFHQITGRSKGGRSHSFNFHHTLK